MADESSIEHVFPSTTFTYKKVKIRTPPAGQNAARAKRGRWYRYVTWPRTRPISLTITYRGGPESWWLVQSRGSQGVFPGSLALEDVMVAVLNEPWPGERR